MDSSFTWVVHGPSVSIGYQVHDAGFDVFLGNVRGIYPRRLAEGKDLKSYWRYSIDHFARFDVQAFLRTIHETKVKELKEIYYKDSQLSDEEITKEISEKLKITYIGHSLGGMVLPMYVIH